ncbi:MAG: nitrile hydratase subunit beta [Pseudomonadota bacterium]
MNGAHDLGGSHGFGEIDRRQQVNFEHFWEQRVFGLTLACGMLGQWNLDQSRYAREDMHPVDYLSSSYYEHWLHGCERLMKERGLVTDSELQSGTASKDNAVMLEAIEPDCVDRILKSGGPTLMETDQLAKFKPGDHVVVCNFHPKSHTRAPRYIRGHRGTVQAHRGAHIFPDQHALDGGRIPAHLYNVRFESETLWGEDAAEAGSAVYVDVFEPYLE